MVPTVFLLPINQGYCPLLKEKGETYPKKQICKVKSIGPHFILLFWVREWKFCGCIHPIHQVTGFQRKPCSTRFKISWAWSYSSVSTECETTLGKALSWGPDLSWSHMTTLVSAFTVSRLLELKLQSGCGQEEGSKEPPSGTQPVPGMAAHAETWTANIWEAETGGWVMSLGIVWATQFRSCFSPPSPQNKTAGPQVQKYYPPAHLSPSLHCIYPCQDPSHQEKTVQVFRGIYTCVSTYILVNHRLKG